MTNDHSNTEQTTETQPTTGKQKQSLENLSGDFHTDTEIFRQLFDRSFDLVFKDMLVGGSYKGLIIFIDGMVDLSLVDQDIIFPLLNSRTELEKGLMRSSHSSTSSAVLQQNIITAYSSRLETNVDNIAEAISGGDTILLIEGSTEAIIIGLRNRESRSIEESPSEPVIRGSRDGFTENLLTNTSLIRRRIKSPKLKIEALEIGELSRSDILLVYLDGVVQEDVLQEVRQRLSKIKIDAVMESGYIEELIEDTTFSPFPQVLSTERPDRVAASILEGRVAIIVDNTPFVLVVPITFLGLLQSSEDYYQRYMIATITRWLRYCLTFMALTFPSLYIAVTTFHQEMLPTNLLLSIASAREAVPFPAIIEAFIMELAFEGLREAGIRMPRPVGQAVSIVGALVIGQAAVQAGIVSAPLVIVVSFTGIASFIFPSYSLGIAIRLLRFPLMLLAGVFGLYGIFLGLLVITIHVLKLRSFGVPYSAPVAPLSPSGLEDSIFRAPWPNLIKRSKRTPNPSD